MYINGQAGGGSRLETTEGPKETVQHRAHVFWTLTGLKKNVGLDPPSHAGLPPSDRELGSG